VRDAHTRKVHAPITLPCRWHLIATGDALKHLHLRFDTTGRKRAVLVQCAVSGASRQPPKMHAGIWNAAAIRE